MPVKFLSSPRAGLLVQALDVARFRNSKRRVDVNLDRTRPHSNSARAMRRSARKGEMNDTITIRPRIGHQLGHLGDAADVLDAVGVGEAQVAVEAVADVVAVEQVGVLAEREQPLLHQVGDGRLARARQAREPQHAGPLALLRRAGLA